MFGLFGGGGAQPRPAAAAPPVQAQPGFFQMLGDTSSPLHAAAMGLGGALLDYGQPQLRPVNTSGAGAMLAGMNGLLGGLAAQRAQAKQDKLDAMLEDLANRQLKIQTQVPVPGMPVQQPPMGMPPRQLFGGAPAPVPPNPMSDTTRLLSGMPRPMMGAGGMPGIY